MCATFTDDDIGKLVERADGKVIGTVASVEEETARVEPAPDVIDTLKARFDWGEIGGPFDLDETDVSEISPNRIHLEEGFSRPNSRTTASKPTSRSDAGSDRADGTGSASEPGRSNRSDGGSSPTNSTASTSGVGPFDSRFQIGAAVVSALSFLIAWSFAWAGYQGSNLLAVGPELDLVSGAVGLMLLGFVSVIALVVAVYMEPGFGR